MKRYIRKPERIEAVQFNGQNFEEIHKFCPRIKYNLKDTNTPLVPGIVGMEKVLLNYFIVKEESGSYRVYGEDLFNYLYEGVGDEKKN